MADKHESETQTKTETKTEHKTERGLESFNAADGSNATEDAKAANGVGDTNAKTPVAKTDRKPTDAAKPDTNSAEATKARC